MRRRSFAMLKRGDVVKLMRVVAETRETEIGCDECFEQLDSFAELALPGVEASRVMSLVSDHLDKCEDCRSTFEGLLTTLRST
jgi:Zn finger protein HypA/HybF involved in hydrogenase expression